jgi:hypothetical protein
MAQIERGILKRLLYPFNFLEACPGIAKIGASDGVGFSKDVKSKKLKISMLRSIASELIIYRA